MFLSNFSAGDADPSKLFLNENVQLLLKALTRKDLARVFKKVRQGQRELDPPTYKFMTDKELQEALKDANERADKLLQMPPVLAVRKPVDRVLSYDPALQGLETSRFVFTDITFGVADSKRLIVVREPDGTLRDADWDVRDRLNQIYFPRAGREVLCPKMFEDDYLKDLLVREEFLFILDRACIQFEPDDPKYQEVASTTYNYINDNRLFEKLRSTRHFGPLVFYLVWNNNIDNLLLDLLETCHIEETNNLLQLYAIIQNVQFSVDNRTDSFDILEEYISKYSKKKGPLELSLQAVKDTHFRNNPLLAKN